jgi:hypothetical protein
MKDYIRIIGYTWKGIYLVVTCWYIHDIAAVSTNLW